MPFLPLFGTTTPPVAGVTYADNFNRADGALGSNWLSTGAAPPTIVSNQVVGGTGATHGIRWVSPTNTDNQFSQLTWSGGQYDGPVVAMSGFASGASAATSPSWYIFRWTSATSISIGYKVANSTSFTVGTTVSYTLVPGDVMRLEYNNGVLTGFINGVSKVTYTPATPITGQRYVGAALFSASQSGVALWDDWSGGDIGGGAPAISGPSIYIFNGTSEVPATLSVVGANSLETSGTLALV